MGEQRSFGAAMATSTSELARGAHQRHGLASPMHTAYDSGELSHPGSERERDYEAGLAREIQLQDLSLDPGFDANATSIEGARDAPAGKSPAPSENGKGLPPGSWSEYFRGLPYKLRGGLDTALPIPDVHELFWSFVGAFVSIMAISLLNHFAGVEEQIVYLVGSFGASAVLLFAVTESKLAQPRNVRKMCAVVVGRKGGMPVPRRGIACSPGLLGWEWVCGCRPCMTSSHCGPMSARRLPQAPAPS
ncbi:hypothetical protein ACKKBG_A16935 [Auxenochlorella protothecoides x Auxenochlorella symbiontica]